MVARLKVIKHKTMAVLSIKIDFDSIENGISHHDFFDSSFYSDIATSSKLQFRMRKVDYGKLMKLTIAQACSNNKDSTIKIDKLRQDYEETFGIEICNKPFHNALVKDEMQDFCATIIKHVYNVVYKNSRNFADLEVKKLVKELNVTDVVAIDGVEISLNHRCIDNLGLPCKSKKEDQAGFKLHIAYSLLHKRILYIDLTSAVESERAHVNIEQLKGCLTLMDRGYSSLNLEDQLDANGIKFIIRAKEKHVGQVINSYNPGNGIKYKHTMWQGYNIPGLTNSKSKKDKDVDFIYNADKTQKIRRIVVIKKQSYVERNESSFSIYRTNIPRSCCNSISIYYLYRCRWQVELVAKSLQSGNSLSGINSGKASINLFYITVCLIAAALKSFYGMKAFKDNLSRMSILKVSCLYTPFVNFFSDIAKGLKKSSIYEREKSLLDTIIRN